MTDFVANTAAQNGEMLQALGLEHVMQLFRDVPSDLLLPPPIATGLSECEAVSHMQRLAASNTFPHFDSYLGGGAYEHYVPAIVSAICSKSEFLTAYTPYQAEISQGTLQTVFEFQSAICALTGMDVANASVYDGASACAEAVLLALRCQPQRTRVVIAENVHPRYREVVVQYLKSHSIEVVLAPFGVDGRITHDVATSLLNDRTAAFLIQSPNFFGAIEDAASLFTAAKAQGVLSILCANPLAYGIYASAGTLGADIAVGDAQPFGISLQFGGPYVGYMAASERLVRQLPGRLVGETIDAKGRRGFVLTLQAREQHIRREKATSNICTNQALAALASLVAMLWYGPEGIKQLALSCYQRACHLRAMLSGIPGLSVNTHVPIFNEFVVKSEHSVSQLQSHCRAHHIEPGIELASFYPQLDQHLLVSVTEMKSLSQLEHYAEAMRGAAR